MSMWHGGPRAGLLLALVCLGLIAAGCGGGSSSSSSSSSGSTEGGSSAEPSAQFLKSKSAGKYVKFGAEASTQEREAANAVVVRNLKAREDADFATQCETLNQKTVTIIQAKNPGNCSAALKKAAEPLTRSKVVRKDTLGGSITAMRVKGDQGYALYHGNDGKDWAVPLEKEGGSWKVGALAMIEL